MADTTTYNRVRVGGSGFTIWYFNGDPIAFARQVAHTSPAPVGPGAVPIQPLDSPYPVQIITPQAAGMGTITLDLYELYGARVWERLGAKATSNESTSGYISAQSSATGGDFHGLVDIVAVFAYQAALANPIRVVKYIYPPSLRGANLPGYTEEFHNCVITNITDGETIEIGTMEVVKQLTIGYTHLTRNGERGDTRLKKEVGGEPSTTTQFGRAG